MRRYVLHEKICGLKIERMGTVKPFKNLFKKEIYIFLCIVTSKMVWFIVKKEMEEKKISNNNNDINEADKVQVRNVL